jgi:hypothetical protein
MPGRRREYLPYGLTAKEKKDPVLRRKLSRCIRSVEKTSCPVSAKRKDGSYNYRKCEVNPVAVCRESLRKKR